MAKYLVFDTQGKAALAAAIVMRSAAGPMQREGHMIDPDTGFPASAVRNGEIVPFALKADIPKETEGG